jgi:hypothetical protein
LLFSEASLSSIKVVKAGLLEFEQLSGLSPRMKYVSLDELRMKEGKFPVRYLGVPLISSKLSAVDCRVLIEKITQRINSWTSKQLHVFCREVLTDYLNSLWLASLLD